MEKTIILTVAIFLLSCTNSFSDNIRRPVVAGAFYPADKAGLKKEIGLFLDSAKKARVNGRIIAIMVPHAGYAYSGRVAAYSFKQLEGRKVNSVVIVSNSHKAYFPGIAVDDSDAWQTPLGLVKVDKVMADRLVNADKAVRYNSKIHANDHPIEVEIPFLQTVLKKGFKIVPVLFGNTRDNSYRRFAQVLADNLGRDDILVISTDMSHYPSYEDANRIDHRTLEAIEEMNLSKLVGHIRKVQAQHVPQEETLLCGIDGVKTVLEMCNILGDTRARVLKYANSGDVEIGDKSRVVGYSSVIFYIPDSLQKKGEEIMKDEYLNKEEKKKLLTIARYSIIEAVTGKKQPEVKITDERLKENCGAFVTIKEHGQLRGCIGYIIAVKPLYETVKDVAASAAINDYRFRPVSGDELDKLKLEISVLTPLKRIKEIDEIEIGRDGLYMKRGLNSGLLLPQVATEYGWDRKTFLEQTCRKAGLATDAWKDKSTEIYIFSAEVFDEKDTE